ncbi:hypothetical protein AN958_01762, partial [Leucoagaricus sp. SymC.cos]
MEKQEPSEDYLKISLEESETLDEATSTDIQVEGLVRKLLVLDLNGTLVYRSPHKPFRGPHAQGASTTAVAVDDVYAQFDPSQPRPIRAVYPRPYLASFRNYLFHPNTKRWLDTMVWSSAQPHSVDDMVEKCFGDRKEELVAVWARDRLGLNASDYGRKVQTTKDLDKPWKELNSASSDVENPVETPEPSSSTTDDEKRNHSAKTTLLLDDSSLKAHLQPYNHLCLKEYDLVMRRHDVNLREWEVVLFASNAEADESAVDVDHPSDTEPGNPRKRKRKAKKENQKRERYEQQLKKLEEEGEHPEGIYDETLLAVVGILDAVKRETNVAAWIRSGRLVAPSHTTLAGDSVARESSIVSEGTESSGTTVESPKKKLKVSEQDEDEDKSSEKEESPSSDHPPPPTSSPPHETSPSTSRGRDRSKTEQTGVPLNEPRNWRDPAQMKKIQDQLWFNRPGALEYWALKGKQVLEDMGIEMVAGVIG